MIRARPMAMPRMIYSNKPRSPGLESQTKAQQVRLRASSQLMPPGKSCLKLSWIMMHATEQVRPEADLCTDEYSVHLGTSSTRVALPSHAECHEHMPASPQPSLWQCQHAADPRQGLQPHRPQHYPGTARSSDPQTLHRPRFLARLDRGQGMLHVALPASSTERH